MLQIGDKMPAFSAADETGKMVTNNDLIGKKTVIYFYPDSQASHIKFKEKYDLPFPLLSDPTTEMLQAFGAWGEKKLYGKVSMGTLRKTFIFNAEGLLERIIEKVDTKNHTAQLLG